MSQDKRKTRFPPERGGPVRHVGGTIRTPGQYPEPGAQTQARANLGEGLREAYRICEEHLERGRDEARRRDQGPGPFAGGPGPGPRGGWGGFGPNPGGGFGTPSWAQPGPHPHMSSPFTPYDWGTTTDPYNVNNAMRAFSWMFSNWAGYLASAMQSGWDQNPFMPGASNPFMQHRPPSYWPGQPGDHGWMPAPPEAPAAWNFVPRGTPRIRVEPSWVTAQPKLERWPRSPKFLLCTLPDRTGPSRLTAVQEGVDFVLELELGDCGEGVHLVVVLDEGDPVPCGVIHLDVPSRSAAR